MATEQQSSVFPWLVWHHGDPGPPIWEIISELDAERQRQVAQVLIKGQIAALNAQISTLNGINEVIG